MGISVLIISYNSEAHIQACLKSVLSQTYRPEQIVVVDDASTDGTWDIIESHREQFPNLFDTYRFDEERGIPESRNFAINQANSELITFLDADDEYRREKLERETAKLAGTDHDFVFSDFEFIGEDGGILRTWSDDGTPPSGDILFECAARKFPDGSLFRDWVGPKECIEAVGKYDTQFPIYEDWDLKIRLAADFSFDYIPEPLTTYRQHNSGISVRTNPSKKADIIARVLNKNEQLIQEHCTPEEFEQIQLEVSQQIKLLNAFHSRKRGNYISAIQSYVQYLQTNQGEIRNWKQHLRFILPKPILVDLRKLYYIIN